MALNSRDIQELADALMSAIKKGSNSGSFVKDQNETGRGGDFTASSKSAKKSFLQLEEQLVKSSEAIKRTNREIFKSAEMFKTLEDLMPGSGLRNASEQLEDILKKQVSEIAPQYKQLVTLGASQIKTSNYGMDAIRQTVEMYKKVSELQDEAVDIRKLENRKQKQNESLNDLQIRLNKQAADIATKRLQIEKRLEDIGQDWATELKSVVSNSAAFNNNLKILNSDQIQEISKFKNATGILNQIAEEHANNLAHAYSKEMHARSQAIDKIGQVATKAGSLFLNNIVGVTKNLQSDSETIRAMTLGVSAEELAAFNNKNRVMLSSMGSASDAFVSAQHVENRKYGLIGKESLAVTQSQLEMFRATGQRAVEGMIQGNAEFGALTGRGIEEASIEMNKLLGADHNIELVRRKGIKAAQAEINMRTRLSLSMGYQSDFIEKMIATGNERKYSSGGDQMSTAINMKILNNRLTAMGKQGLSEEEQRLLSVNDLSLLSEDQQKTRAAAVDRVSQINSEVIRDQQKGLLTGDMTKVIKGDIDRQFISNALDGIMTEKDRVESSTIAQQRRLSGQTGEGIEAPKNLTNAIEDNFLKFANYLQGFNASILAFGGSVATFALAVFKDAAMRGMWAKGGFMDAIFGGKGKGKGGKIGGLLNTGKEFLGKHGGKILKGGGIAAIAGLLIDPITEMASDAFGGEKTTAGNAIKKGGSILGNVAMGAGLGSIFGPVGTAVGAGLGLVKGVWDEIIPTEWKDAIFAAGESVISTLIKWSPMTILKDLIFEGKSETLNYAIDMMKSAYSKVASWSPLGFLYDMLKSGMSYVTSYLSDSFTAMLDKIKEFDIIAEIKNIFTGIGHATLSAVQTMLNTLPDLSKMGETALEYAANNLIPGMGLAKHIANDMATPDAKAVADATLLSPDLKEAIRQQVVADMTRITIPTSTDNLKLDNIKDGFSISPPVSPLTEESRSMLGETAGNPELDTAIRKNTTNTSEINEMTKEMLEIERIRFQRETEKYLQTTALRTALSTFGSASIAAFATGLLG